jgi:hypothetical protein
MYFGIRLHPVVRPPYFMRTDLAHFGHAFTWLRAIFMQEKISVYLEDYIYDMRPGRFTRQLLFKKDKQSSFLYFCLLGNAASTV